MPRGYKDIKRKRLTQPRRPKPPAAPLSSLPDPPDASSGLWLVTEYAHSWEDGCLYIACVTDVPCHLTLRWTDKPMGMHNRSTDLGGYGFIADPKYCLVEYNEVEQNEDGDTLTHTFHFCGWEVCTWRWWYLVGTVGGEPSPSASCIFQAHCPDQEEAESLNHTDLLQKEVAGVIDHADGSITPDKLQYPFQFAGWPETPSGLPSTDLEIANKRYIDESLIDPQIGFLNQNNIHIISDFTPFTPTEISGGSASHDLAYAYCQTAAAAGSLAVLDKLIYQLFGSNVPLPAIHWDYDLTISFFANFDIAGSATERYAWLRIGQDNDTYIHSLQGVGFLFNRDNYKLYTQSRNAFGIEETLVSEGVDFSQKLRRFSIKHKPGVGEYFYMDGSLQAIHTNRVLSGYVANSARILIGAHSPFNDNAQTCFCNRVVLLTQWR